jgi:hypothetical protein
VIVSPDLLRKELVSLLAQIDGQIIEIKREARQKGLEPKELRTEDGNWVMIPLLAAKVSAISTLAQLNQYQKRER